MMMRRKLISFALLAIPTFYCQASMLTSSTSVATGLMAGSGTILSGGPIGLTPGVGSASGSATFQGINGVLQAEATAYAIVGYGYFHIHAFTSVTDFTGVGPGHIGPYSVADATASASFTDTMTIFGGTGVANLTWQITDLSHLATYSVPAQVIFGVPFQISASAAIDQGSNYSGPVAQKDIQFAISYLWVNGSSTGYSYTTDSDQAYPFSGRFVSMPEPSSFALAFAGLLLYCVCKLRRAPGARVALPLER